MTEKVILSNIKKIESKRYFLIEKDGVAKFTFFALIDVTLFLRFVLISFSSYKIVLVSCYYKTYNIFDGIYLITSNS